MVNVVLKGVEQCGHLEGENAKCGLAVGVLTKTFAGIAASSSGVTAKCPNALNNNAGLTFLVTDPKVTQGNSALASAAQQASFAQCVVNVKDLTKAIFKASKRLVTIKSNCEGDDKNGCAHNALKVVASFAAMGEYLAGAVGRCSANTAANAQLRENAQCTAEVTKLVGSLHRMASASIDMKANCMEGETRLYQLEHGEVADNQNGSMATFALAAFLPLTAVLAFVGGSRYAKANIHHPASTTESEVLVE